MTGSSIDQVLLEKAWKSSTPLCQLRVAHRPEIDHGVRWWRKIRMTYLQCSWSNAGRLYKGKSGFCYRESPWRAGGGVWLESPLPNTIFPLFRTAWSNWRPSQDLRGQSHIAGRPWQRPTTSNIRNAGLSVLFALGFTFSKNLIAVHGKAACPGSYCTTQSPHSTNLSIQVAIFVNRSRSTTAFLPGPLCTVHCFCWHSCFLSSTTASKSSNLAAELKLMQTLFLSLSCEAARSHKFLQHDSLVSCLVVRCRSDNGEESRD